MTPPTVAEFLRSTFGGAQGSSARVVVAWTLAGGSTTGGLILGTLAFLGRSPPGLLILVGPLLFVAGTLAGMLHGVVLGVVGRPAKMRRREALRRTALGAAISLPLLPLAWLTSAAITVGSALEVGFRLRWLLVGAVGWVIALGLCAWALREGWVQARRAYRRCRRRHLGLCLTVLVAGGGAVALQRMGPAVPGFDQAPGWHLSIPMSMLATLWFWVPFVYLALQGERSPEPSPPEGGGRGSGV